MIKHFEVPESVSKCLDGNAELDALAKKYGITNKSDPDVIIAKIGAYVALHFLEVHKNTCDWNTAWKAGKYYDVGKNGGAYVHKILGATEEDAQLAKAVDVYKTIKQIADIILSFNMSKNLQVE